MSEWRIECLEDMKEERIYYCKMTKKLKIRMTQKYGRENDEKITESNRSVTEDDRENDRRMTEK